MQISEFVEATTRLEEYYNKEYTKEQRQIMFEELGDFELDRYKFSVSQAIKTCKYLPKVSEIIQLDKDNPPKSKEEEITKVECSKCNSLGYIIYKKRTKEGLEYNYAAICDCGNAKQYKGWEIKGDHKSNYYTPMAKELNLI